MLRSQIKCIDFEYFVNNIIYKLYIQIIKVNTIVINLEKYSLAKYSLAKK